MGVVYSNEILTDNEDKNYSILEFYKPRGVIHAIYKESLTSIQKRTLNALYMNASYQLKKLVNERPEELLQILKQEAIIPFMIDAVELTKMVNVDGGSSGKSKYKTSRIIDAIKRLRRVEVEFNYLKKDNGIVKKDLFTDVFQVKYDYDNLPEGMGWGIDSLIDGVYVENIGGRKMIKYYIPFQLAIRLLHPRSYTKMNILNFAFFSKTYDMTIFEILSDFYAMAKHINGKFKQGTSDENEVMHKISIAKFCKLVLPKDSKMLEGEEYFRFRNKILLPAIKRLNKEEIVPFEVELVYQKVGRKITDLIFKFRDKKSYKIPVMKKGVIVLIDDEYIETKSKDPEDSFFEKMENVAEKINKLDEIARQIEAGKITFKKFKAALSETKNLKICDGVEGRMEHLILQTNDIGYLELYDPKDEKVIELEYKEAEEIKKWLFRNPRKIGSFLYQNLMSDISNNKEKKKKKVNKFMVVNKDGEMKVAFISHISTENELSCKYSIAIDGKKKTITAPPVEQIKHYIFSNEEEAKLFILKKRIREFWGKRTIDIKDGLRVICKDAFIKEGDMDKKIGLTFTDLQNDHVLFFKDTDEAESFLHSKIS